MVTRAAHPVAAWFILVVSTMHCVALPLSQQRASEIAFDLDTAILATEFSRAAYCPADTLTNWTCLLCTNKTKDFEPYWVTPENPKSVQAFVGRGDGQILVAFRGSVDLSNWIQNLRFFKVDSNFTDSGCTDCKVHRGFYESYMEVHEPLTKAVNHLRALHPDDAILVTGHSLGGALAAHAALDLIVNHGHQNVNSVTLGEPRVGNRPFAEYYRSKLPQAVRLVHANDVVPHLPPGDEIPLIDLDFYHEPTEVWNTANISCKVCDGSGEDQKCSDSLPPTQWSATDHGFYLDLHMGACRDESGAIQPPLPKRLWDYELGQ